MQIGITNPLREFLRWRPFPPNTEEPMLFCWDAHRVKVDGRVMLVICNAANRFAVVDGRRYDPEQFFGLFTGHVGFDLHWSIHEPSDDLP